MRKNVVAPFLLALFVLYTISHIHKRTSGGELIQTWQIWTIQSIRRLVQWWVNVIVVCVDCCVMWVLDCMMMNDDDHDDWIVIGKLKKLILIQVHSLKLPIKVRLQGTNPTQLTIVIVDSKSYHKPNNWISHKFTNSSVSRVASQNRETRQPEPWETKNLIGRFPGNLQPLSHNVTFYFYFIKFIL